MAAKRRGKSWAEVREETRAYRAELGLTSPTEDPDPLASRGLEVRVPAEGTPGVPRRAKHGRGRITEDCLAALERFDRDLPPRAARTRKA